jgi:GNAT superfamily N-acetyltransferase
VRAILHLLDDPARLPPPSDAVRFLDADALARVDAPAELRRELDVAARRSPIAATFVGGAPVAFCYAGAVTESLWDVAIDTLEGHRRRGHAAACAAYMIRHMLPAGRRPVWGSHEDNPASWQLARKIGFAPSDELVLFRPPGAAGA